MFRRVEEGMKGWNIGWSVRRALREPLQYYQCSPFPSRLISHFVALIRNMLPGRRPSYVTITIAPIIPSVWHHAFTEFEFRAKFIQVRRLFCLNTLWVWVWAWAGGPARRGPGLGGGVVWVVLRGWVSWVCGRCEWMCLDLPQWE